MSEVLKPGEALYQALAQAVSLSQWKLRGELLSKCIKNPTKRGAVITVDCFNPTCFYFADLMCAIEAVWLGDKRLAIIFTVTNETPGNILETLSLDITDTETPVKKYWTSLLRCMVVSHPDMLNNIHQNQAHFGDSNPHRTHETPLPVYDDECLAIWNELTTCVLDVPHEEE